jgi:glycosyltransferase involved in cell wall biosynthesis
MTTKHPLVSIIIPCYNAERYLQETLECALSQSYPNKEVIVVNDGSKDSTLKIAQSYGEQVRIVEQANAGVSAARNNGVRHADGEYVLFLDADDLLSQDAIEKKVKLLESDDQIGLVVGHYREIDQDGKLLDRIPRKRSYPKSENNFYRALKQALPPSGWIMRKNVFLQCGYFDPFLKGSEDWDVMIRCCAKYKIVYDPEPNMLYRQIPTSASVNALLMYQDALKMLTKNSILIKSPFLYWLYAQIGIYYACEFSLYRLWKNSRGVGNFARRWIQSCVSFPKYFLHSTTVFAILPFRVVLLKCRSDK